MASILQAPIIFKPYFKSVIWGGDKICQLKGIKQEIENIGESWEISQLPGFETIVSEGEYKGLTLSDLIERFDKELLGDFVVKKYGKRFPLLVKLIDANDNLSIQVHPNDSLAWERHKSLGKTEMWYVLSSEKDSKIYAGLKENFSPELYEKRLEDDSFLEIIKTFDAKREDVYFLPPGTVHAIGSGNLLTEIQEASDITYRIYDYNRKDAGGNKRELHTSLAKDAISYEADECCLKTNTCDEDETLLVKCEHFITHKYKVRGEKILERNKESFTILICTEGSVEVNCKEGKCVISKGHSALVPASADKFSLNGEGVILLTSVI